MTLKYVSELVSWRTVSHLVKPFYEGFFGMEIPSGDKITIFSTQVINKPGGKYYHNDSMIEVGASSAEEAAILLVHELAHMAFEHESGMLRKLPSRVWPWNYHSFRKKLSKTYFVHETVAEAAMYSYLFRNGNADEIETERKKIMCPVDYFWKHIEIEALSSEKATKSSELSLKISQAGHEDLWSKLKEVRSERDLVALL